MELSGTHKRCVNLLNFCQIDAVVVNALLSLNSRESLSWSIILNVGSPSIVVVTVRVLGIVN